jgi:hypothetical protein
MPTASVGMAPNHYSERETALISFVEMTLPNGSMVTRPVRTQFLRSFAQILSGWNGGIGIFWGLGSS